MDDTSRINRIYNIEGIFQLFVSIGAIPAGIMMIITPDGSSLGMEEIVDVIPFDNLIIPGLLLILINGLGQGLAGWLSLQKHEYASYAGFICPSNLDCCPSYHGGRYSLCPYSLFYYWTSRGCTISSDVSKT